MGTKAAKDATAKAELATKQRVVALERTLAEEADRREKAEASMHNLEAEVEMLKKGDDKGLSKLSKSMTSQVAAATEEARKWKAKAASDAHKLEEQASVLNTDLQHALEDVKHAKQDTEQAVLQRAYHART